MRHCYIIIKLAEYDNRWEDLNGSEMFAYEAV